MIFFGLRNVDLKLQYRTDDEEDILQIFYIPILSNAILYKRAVGYFSSSVLIKLSLGITELLKSGGKMQIIASPELSKEDVQAIKKGYESKESIIEKAVVRSITPPITVEDKERYNYLAFLISENKLEIKIALVDDNDIGIYHEKIGIIEDISGDMIAFTGSANETASALVINFESIDVFKSWASLSDCERVRLKNNNFNKLWNNETKKLKVYDFTDAFRSELIKYKKNEYIDEKLLYKNTYIKEDQNLFVIKEKYPRIPDDFIIRDYQINAINAWRNNNYKGLLNMATGTGKTLTALTALTTLWNELKSKLAIIIVCPYTHLVEQWSEDVIKFNMDPLICHSSSKNSNWKDKILKIIKRYNLNILKNICILVTNSTYKTNYFQNCIVNINTNVLFIVDEAHNVGSNEFKNKLNKKFEYRLALSATPHRHFDEEGTKVLLDYFSKEVFYFGLQEAIEKGFLTKYYYYPIFVYLDDNEFEEYFELSIKISKLVYDLNNDTSDITQIAKTLMIKRAKILAGAKSKLKALKELMTNKRDSYYNLIYCGATYIEDDIDNDSKRQIEAVTNLLGNDLGMRISKFTAEEKLDERENIINSFGSGNSLQGIAAIKCLDEGVNIPSIQNAYILASSTNPREYIQRRGRVLRKYPGKIFAYIYDFITLPRTFSQISLLDESFLKYDLSIIKREMSRAKEFAELAINKLESLDELDKIELEYQKYI